MVRVFDSQIGKRSIYASSSAVTFMSGVLVIYVPVDELLLEASYLFMLYFQAIFFS